MKTADSTADTPRVDMALDAGSRLGEGIVWCERAQALYWTDIEAQTLHRWRPTDGARQQWPMPERLGSFALCAAPHRLLLGLASGIALFDLDTGSVGPLVPVEPELATTRINDGRCDRQGRFVFGTFNEAHGGGAIGSFYRVTPDLRIERLPLPTVRVPNSIAFSPSGDTLYFADSPTREIRCASYGADGQVGPWRVFARMADGDGYPDGATVDAAGGLWSTRWDGGCIVRHAPDGSETHRVALPVTRPTCPAFGGPALEDLFVITASVGLKPDALARQPMAGGLLRLSGCGRGLAEPRFGEG